MYSQSIGTTSTYLDNIPVIDGEFDRFELNNDLEMQLREADSANFYHNTLNPEE